MDSSETIAVLGAGGTMGFPMARNLARAGTGVRAWNRTREKAEPLATEKVQVADSPAAAASDSSVILTILADTDAVLSAVDGPQGALQSAGESTIWLQMSTIGEEGTERCMELAREHDVEFVDAPVLGTKQPAEEGKLVVLASGPAELSDRLRTSFDTIGQRTMRTGGLSAGTRQT